MIRAIGNKIVVKEVKTEQITEGGIVLPDNLSEKGVIGEVVSVGPLVFEDTPTYLNSGDKVVFVYGSGEDVELFDQIYKIMTEADIIAKVN